MGLWSRLTDWLSLGGPRPPSRGTFAQRLEVPQVREVEAALGRTLPVELVKFYESDPRRLQDELKLPEDEVAGIAWFLPLDLETLREHAPSQDLLPLATDGCFDLYVVDLASPGHRVPFLDEGPDGVEVVRDDLASFLRDLEPARPA